MGSNRWWESYLVRYFMPSIAGVAIVTWLLWIAGPELKELLFLEEWADDLSSPTLILLVLYGNLFCYIASYPVLGFHSTRVIDFPEGRWHPKWTDGYIASACLALIGLAACIVVPSRLAFATAMVLTACYSILQLVRVGLSLRLVSMKGLEEQASLAYAYAHALAKRRGALEVTQLTKEASHEVSEHGSHESSSERKTQWHKEIVETYRHMREHGNSAFIFLLELVLAALCFLAIKDPHADVSVKLTRLALVLAAWAVPAAMVHMLGQVMERRFSHFDRRSRQSYSPPTRVKRGPNRQ